MEFSGRRAHVGAVLSGIVANRKISDWYEGWCREVCGLVTKEHYWTGA